MSDPISRLDPFEIEKIATRNPYVISCSVRHKLFRPIFKKNQWWKFWLNPVEFTGMKEMLNYSQWMKVIQGEESKAYFAMNPEQLESYFLNNAKKKFSHVVSVSHFQLESATWLSSYVPTITNASISMIGATTNEKILEAGLTVEQPRTNLLPNSKSE